MLRCAPPHSPITSRSPRLCAIPSALGLARVRGLAWLNNLAATHTAASSGRASRLAGRLQPEVGATKAVFAPSLASQFPGSLARRGRLMHARLPLLPRLLRATALSPGGQTRFHSAERLMEPVYGGGEGRVVVVAVSGTL